LPPGSTRKSWGSQEVRGSATADSERAYCPLVLRLEGASTGYPAPRTVPVKSPNVHPACVNVPRIGDDGFEEVCHLVTEDDPDTALCGKDVTGYPWNPPWPRCEACLAVARGEMN
jgi:hypothetical protein